MNFVCEFFLLFVQINKIYIFSNSIATYALLFKLHNPLLRLLLNILPIATLLT